MERPTDNLIYNRTSSDVQRVAELNRKISKGEATAEEVQEWFQSKGALNHTDLNRIETWTEFLSNYLKSYGYNAPIKKRAERTYIPQMAPVEVESVLPEGYIQLSYIESTGTQYVDTGFKANQDTRVEADIEVTEGATSFLFGARNNSSANATSNSFSMPQISGTSLRSDYGSVESNVSVSPVQRLKIDKNKNVTNVNGTTVTATMQTFSCPHNLVMLAVNTAGTISAKTSARLYSFKIYENDVLARNFIPCRNASGDVGLFDTVTQTFFGNAGTGVFLPGEVVATLPEGYERAFYIESFGAQYIDTAYIPNGKTRLALDVTITNDVASFYALFGARTATSANAFSFWINDGVLYPQYGSVLYSKNPINIAPEGRLRIDMNRNVVDVNGNTVIATSATFNSVYSLALLSNNQAGAIDARMPLAQIRACQIYDDGIIVRNYIPCKNSVGEFGLFDLVEQKFYGNAGTGSFLGTVVRKLPEGYTQVDYIESSGTQYVDTGFKPNQDTGVSLDFEINAGAISTTTSLLGGRTAYQNNDFSFWCFNTSQWLTVYGTELAYIDAGSFAGRHTLNKNKNVTTIDGKTSTANFNNFQSPNNMFLFTKKQDGAMETKFAVMKVYACQIYDNDVLVRDYVPCTNAQGTAGLYDVANDVFYANAGTGTFTIGEEISIPEGGGGTLIPDAEPIVYSDWRIWDIPELIEINRIRDNVNSIQAGFYNLSDWREILCKNNPNYEDINTLEWDLQSIYQWLNLIMLNFRFSGEIYAGEVW